MGPLQGPRFNNKKTLPERGPVSNVTFITRRARTADRRARDTSSMDFATWYPWRAGLDFTFNQSSSWPGDCTSWLLKANRNTWGHFPLDSLSLLSFSFRLIIVSTISNKACRPHTVASSSRVWRGGSSVNVKISTGVQRRSSTSFGAKSLPPWNALTGWQRWVHSGQPNMVCSVISFRWLQYRHTGEGVWLIQCRNC